MIFTSIFDREKSTKLVSFLKIQAITLNHITQTKLVEQITNYTLISNAGGIFTKVSRKSVSLLYMETEILHIKD